MIRYAPVRRGRSWRILHRPCKRNEISLGEGLQQRRDRLPQNVVRIGDVCRILSCIALVPV